MTIGPYPSTSEAVQSALTFPSTKSKVKKCIFASSKLTVTFKLYSSKRILYLTFNFPNIKMAAIVTTLK